MKLLEESAGAPVADLTLKVQENLDEEVHQKQQIQGILILIYQIVRHLLTALLLKKKLNLIWQP